MASSRLMTSARSLAGSGRSVELMRYPFIMHGVTLLMAVWAVLTTLSRHALGATPVSGIHEYLDRTPMVLALSLSAVCAVWALCVRPSRLTLLALLPQQILLFMAAANSVEAVVESHYADGVSRPWAFIAADQAWIIIGVAAYTLAVGFAHRRP